MNKLHQTINSILGIDGVFRKNALNTQIAILHAWLVGFSSMIMKSVVSKNALPFDGKIFKSPTQLISEGIMEVASLLRY